MKAVVEQLVGQDDLLLLCHKKKGVQNKLCEEFFALVSNYDWLCEMKHAGYGVSVCLISKVMTSYKLFVRNRKKEEKKFILTVSQAL